MIRSNATRALKNTCRCVSGKLSDIEEGCIKEAFGKGTKGAIAKDVGDIQWYVCFRLQRGKWRKTRR